VLDDGAPPERVPGAASRWWLERSLAALAGNLAGHGIQLILRRGPPENAIADVIAATGAAVLHCSRSYTAWGARLEARVRARVAPLGATCRCHRGFLLFEPEAVRTAAGAPFQVFTPFARACRRLGVTHVPQGRPLRLVPHPHAIAGDRLADWCLYDGRPDWARQFATCWRPGEAGARARLRHFAASALAGYAEGRDRPDLAATSALSPHLHFGEVGPLQVWHAVAAAMAQAGGHLDRAGDKFLSELLWREFCYALLAQQPALHDVPIRPAFARLGWRDDAAGLAAWQQGATGLPVVDAGLRELWRTGFMHNRVRMIAASFLVKNLLIDWRRGERWFWDTLVDADAASNAAGWQWVAGCGADAAPWFRIFNPVLQGEAFDPDGAYVGRFVPELAGLPARFIHRPWAAPDAVLAAAGIRLGTTYPHPVVDLQASRRRALAAYDAVKAR
jgi:deoxyribodipyrimidine photo-lyase